MKKILLIVAALTAVLQSQATELKMRVTTDSLNMRAKPSLEVETVEPQLNRGDIVTVRNIMGEWAEVVPPSDAKLYIHREFAKDDIVGVARLRVRSGPSINYKEVGVLNRGDRINVRATHGDWLQIAPPPESSLWISLEFLEDIRAEPSERAPRIQVPEPIVGEQVSTPQVERPPVRQTPVREQQTPVRVERQAPARPARPEVEVARRPPERQTTVPIVEPVRRDDPVPEDFVPEGLDLIPLEGQGSPIEMTGILRRSGINPFSSRPTRYRLVVVRGNGFATICYIKGNENQLRSLHDQRLRIRGRQYWVRGEDVPVIVPTQIIPLN